jgi:hypothetical protein
MGLLTFSTLGLVASDWLSPASASANSDEASAKKLLARKFTYLYR